MNTFLWELVYYLTPVSLIAHVFYPLLAVIPLLSVFFLYRALVKKWLPLYSVVYLALFALAIYMALPLSSSIFDSVLVPLAFLALLLWPIAMAIVARYRHRNSQLVWQYLLSLLIGYLAFCEFFSYLYFLAKS